jgi:hypothetical protein
MKKLLLLIGACIALASCEWDPQSAKIVDEMKCPVIMIAEHSQDSVSYGSIVLQSADGKMKEFVCKFAFSTAISDTFNPGDTIKKCK